MSNNGKGKTPSAKVQPGESFADAVREGLDDNDNHETPPPYSSGAGGSASNGDSKSASHTVVQSGANSGSNGDGNSKGVSLHIPNSHHAAPPSPSPGGQSHPHSHHFSTQHQHRHSRREVDESMWPFGGPRARETEEGRIVMVPEREYVFALMRARRRFWATLFWALLIYLVAG